MKEEALNHEVIQLFSQLSRIPRESGNEKAVSDWIKSWAEERGLQVAQDDISEKERELAMARLKRALVRSSIAK